MFLVAGVELNYSRYATPVVRYLPLSAPLPIAALSCVLHDASLPPSAVLQEDSLPFFFDAFFAASAPFSSLPQDPLPQPLSAAIKILSPVLST